MTPYPDVTLAEGRHYDPAFDDYPADTVEAADIHLVSVLGEIADRRYEQDRKWGGPAHDDQHTTPEWVALLCLYVGALHKGDADHRESLVDIAALCVAAAQAWDRQQVAPGEAGEHVHPEPVEGTHE